MSNKIYMGSSLLICSENELWLYRYIYSQNLNLFQQAYILIKSATLSKMTLWHKCFHVNFVKIINSTFFLEHVCTAAFETVTGNSLGNSARVKNVQSGMKKTLYNIIFFNSISQVKMFSMGWKSQDNQPFKYVTGF